MNKIALLMFMSLLGNVFCQGTWETGSINFNHGNPFPNQSTQYTGDLLSNEIPGQGVGGFTLRTGDTNVLTLVAYDIHVTNSDTTADIFTIFIQDTLEIETGVHTIGYGTNSVKIFLWMQDVDPALVASLLDTSFTLDSLDVLNPYLSLAGHIEISEIGETSIAGSFAGTAINTSMEFMMVADGTFSLMHNLPALAFKQGSLSVTSGAEVAVIEGELNPLRNERGVGGIESQIGDTLTTTIIAYAPNEFGTALSIYGVVFNGLTESYPGLGESTDFNMSATAGDFPVAIPFYLENASIGQLTQLLSTDSLPQIEDFENIFFPGGTGVVTLGYDDAQTAWVSLADIVLVNSSATTITLSEEWLLNRSTLTSLNPTTLQQPSQNSMIGSVYPNPFNSSTVIPFELQVGRTLHVTIYNSLGQQVAEKPMGTFGAGQHRYHLDLGDSNLSAGLYHFSLSTATQSLGTSSFIYLK